MTQLAPYHGTVTVNTELLLIISGSAMDDSPANTPLQRDDKTSEAGLQDHPAHRGHGEQGEAGPEVLQAQLALQAKQNTHVWFHVQK